MVDREIKEIINDLGYKRFRGEEIDEEYERDCEIRIQKLKQDFNIWGSEVRKKEKAYEDEKRRKERLISTFLRSLDTFLTWEEEIRRKYYLLLEKINAFSLSPPIPISPILCPSSTFPVVDIDLPLEEADVTREDTTSIDDLPLDDSMIFSEYESFTFDDEPVMAEVNVFDEINTSELSYPGIGENVVLDEEEDSFTFTTRSFLPFVTYPEVLPTSYSTGSEDKVFKPGIFDNDAFKDKSSKELDTSKGSF
ncbi:hypothetical protein Tco_1313198 [Tanacetum coccineum]